MCIFTTEACSLHPVVQNGSRLACCSETPALSASAQVWYYPLAAFGVFYLGLFTWRRSRFSDGDGAANPYTVMFGPKPGQPAWKGLLLLLVFAGTIAALIAESVIMPKSIQETLSPTNRASQLAMGAFLTPVEEIFAFIEDSMVVQVG